MVVKHEVDTSHSLTDSLRGAVERCLEADTDGSERYPTEAYIVVAGRAETLGLSVSDFLTQERNRRVEPLQTAVDRTLNLLGQVYVEAIKAGVVDATNLTLEVQELAGRPYKRAVTEIKPQQ